MLIAVGRSLITFSTLFVTICFSYELKHVQDLTQQPQPTIESLYQPEKGAKYDYLYDGFLGGLLWFVVIAEVILMGSLAVISIMFMQ